MELELPSTGEKIKYRPFTVKEEKILLVAQESKDPEQEVLAAKQIVNNCLIDVDISERCKKLRFSAGSKLEKTATSIEFCPKTPALLCFLHQ